MNEKTSEAANETPACRTELRRVFALADLPEPLTRAGEHQQFFDNYIENTRLRLRTIRAPQTKRWSWILEQRFPAGENDLSVWRVSEIHLNEAEHAAFEMFEGREIRKNERVESSELRFNRYFYDLGGAPHTVRRPVEIDVFLNPLWGLHLAKVFFETVEEMRNFAPPAFAVIEVTQNEFFTGAKLVGKTIEDVRAELQK